MRNIFNVPLLLVFVVIYFTALCNRVVINEARANEILRIAAVVNDDVISLYDLISRLDIVIATSNLKDSRNLRTQIAPQVLRTMIDEHLQVQEATRLKIEISDESLKNAITRLDKRNGMPQGSFEKFIDSRKLNRESIDDQIRAEISWGQVVTRRFSRTVTVGEDEIDDALFQLESSRGKPEYLISEIFLSLDGSDQESSVVKVSLDLATQLKKGADFSAIARQFSQSATAAVGGDIGWVLENQLPADISNTIKNLKPGDVSEPIRTFDGIYIVRLNSKRRVLTADPLNTKVKLAQIVIDNKNTTSRDTQIKILSQFGNISKNCKELLEKSAGKLSPLSGNLGTIILRDLPESLRSTISNIDIGQLSKPVAYDNGLRAIMVCERDESKVLPPTRKQMHLNIANKRLELLARRYLRDIRRQAFIDIRI